MKKIVCFLMILLSSRAICQEIEWVVKPKFDFDSVYYFREKRAVFKDKSGLFGFVDETGKVKIPAIFNSLSNFNEGIAVCVINKKRGFINKDGKTIIEPKFAIAGNFIDGLAKVFDREGKSYFINKEGKPLGDNKFDGLYDFKDGFAVAINYADKDYDSKKLKYGFINETGEIVIPLKYKYAQPFYQGLAVVYDKKFKYIDPKGKEVFKNLKKYDWIDNFHEDKALVQLNTKFGYINLEGKEIIEPKYYNATGFDNGHAIIINRLKRKGLIFSDIEIEYLEHGFISSTGEVKMLKGIYDTVDPYGRGLFLANSKGKYSIIDFNEKNIGSQYFDEVGFLLDGNLKVRKGNQYGVLDLLGKEMIPIAFDEILNFEELPAMVRKNNEWFIYDENNRFSDINFEDATSFAEGLAWVKQNGKWGIIKNPLTNSSQPDKIIWLNPKSQQNAVASTKVNDKNFKIEAIISSNLSEGQIKKNTDIIINSVSQKGIRLGNPGTRASSQNTFFFEQVVELNEGKNLIKIVTTLPNGKIIESSTAEIFYSTKPANLFLYSFGVQSDLRFTANDAKAIYELFRTQVGKTFDKVYALPPFISNEATTASSIRKNLESLSKRKDINKEDVVIVFISSHGNEDDDGNFRLQGSDWNSTSPTESSVSFKNHIIGYLDKLNCKKIILIDACHSGNGTKEVPADINKAIADAPPGTIIITSSTGIETSVEHPSWQNGAFTKAIIEALRDKKAKYDKDNILYIPALFAYIEKRVPQIVQSVPEFKSKSQSPQIKNSQNLPIYWAK